MRIMSRKHRSAHVTALSRDCAYLVREHGMTVLYFKRVAGESFVPNQFPDGHWEVVRQEGTAMVSFTSGNSHRTTLASFAEEADADAFLISKGARP